MGAVFCALDPDFTKWTQILRRMVTAPCYAVRVLNYYSPSQPAPWDRFFRRENRLTESHRKINNRS